MMKVLKLFFFLLLLPVFAQAQNCSANPGGDRAICNCDPMVLLGENSEYYLEPLDVTWTIISTPMEVTLDDPNILQPTVTPVKGDCFENGDYVFEMTVVCIDSEPAVATLTVTVGSIDNPPTILAPYTDQADVCGTSVNIQGSPLDPGVSSIWQIEPNLFVTLVPSVDGSSVEVIHNPNNSTVCDYVLSYYQNIGSCDDITYTKIRFTKEHPNLVINNFERTCSRRTSLSGTSPGCNGTPCWTQPEGQNAAISNKNSTSPSVTVTEDGFYTFCYTIENGICETSETCRTEFIGGSSDLNLEGGVLYLDCSDNWVLESENYSVNPMNVNDPNATYVWTASSNVPILPNDPNNNWINIPPGPNGNEITVTFDDISGVDLPDGLSATISVQVTNSDGCTAFKNWIYFYSPEVGVTSSSVNLVCGGDPFFPINTYITTNATGGNRTAQVLASPNPNLPTGEPAFTVNSNTFLDLSAEGFYSFLIQVSREGVDPATGVSVTCTDETVFDVFVSNIPTINAGTDIETCLLIAQLNGSVPIDVNGNVVDLPVSWELISGQSGVIITDADIQDPIITGLDYGETYVFKYSFSTDPDCIREDEVTVTVLPREECKICELTAEVDLEECRDGCVQAFVEGAETYLWVPAEGVDDPTSANPIICTSVEQTYTVYGYVDGEACGFAQVDVACERPFTCDGFYVQQSCTTCSCGKPVVRLRLFDSNGNPVDDQEITITWSIYDQVVEGGSNPFLTYYEGPATYSAQVQYTNGKEVCDTTIIGVATCLGDCPNFSVATCAELPNSEEYEECQYGGDFCDYGAGPLFIVDDTGYPVSGYYIEWPDWVWNANQNPANVSIPDCGSVDVRIWNFSGCDTTITYSPDCCNLTAPMVECVEGEKSGIRWPEVCGTAYYEVEMMCLNGNANYDIVQVSQISNDGYYYFTPDFSDCKFWAYRVVGICESTKTYGNYSDCFFIDNNGYCFTDEFLCEAFFGGEGQGKGGERQARRAEILKELGWAGESSLSPNPVRGEEVYLNMAQQIVNGHEEVEVRVLGLDGKVYHSNILAASSATNIISTAELPAGLYFVSIYSTDGAFLESKRLVKN